CCVTRSSVFHRIGSVTSCSSDSGARGFCHKCCGHWLVAVANVETSGGTLFSFADLVEVGGAAFADGADGTHIAKAVSNSLSDPATDFKTLGDVAGMEWLRQVAGKKFQ